MSRKAADSILDGGAILVTGAGGFVGQRLMELLCMGSGDFAVDLTTDFHAPPGVRKFAWKLPGKAPAELRDVRYVIHLAALSSVANSRLERELFMRVNTTGTESVVMWMKQYAPEALMLFAGSAEVYRWSNNKLDEDSPVAPGNPYGESKLAAEYLLAPSGIKYVIARSFPHFGPGQAGHFVLPSFCRRVIRTAERGGGTVRTGNLAAVRDYLYIDDVARAYARLLSRGKAGEVYNVCSGTGHSIGELLSTIIGFSGAPCSVETVSELLRENDQSCQIGNPGKLKSLGWDVEVPLEQGLSMLYQWWKERL